MAITITRVTEANAEDLLSQIDYLQKSRLIIELNEREGQSISKN